MNRSDSQEAGQPSLAAIGGVPHVAWREQDTGGNFEIRVASLGESSWEEVSSEADATGGGINRAGDQNAGQPNLTAVAGIPHVAWREQHGAEDDSNFEIRVAKLDGSTWEEISSEADAGDGGINRANDQEARDPSVTAVGSTLHVAWRESDDTNDELRVASFDQTTATWAEISSAASETSGGINQAGEESAEQPTLAAIAGVPYVAWSEDDGPNNEIRVSRLNAAGTAWEQVVAADSPINQADDQDARDASLTAIAGVPHVAWSEDDDANDELRVSRLEPEFTAQTATPSSAGATLVADVHSYGIAYAVGFQFGPGLGSNTSTVTTSTGSQNVSVSRQVTGLSPSTGYQFLPSQWRASRSRECSVRRSRSRRSRRRRPQHPATRHRATPLPAGRLPRRTPRVPNSS